MELTQAQKLEQAGIKRYGSLEAYHKALKERASRGGKAKRSVPTGFAAMNPEKRREAGRKGAMNRWAKREQNKA